MLGRDRTLVMLHLRVFESFSSLLFPIDAFNGFERRPRRQSVFLDALDFNPSASLVFFYDFTFSKKLKHIFSLLE